MKATLQELVPHLNLVGEGWDLKLISGKGPDELRILNSDMGKYVTVIG